MSGLSFPGRIVAASVFTTMSATTWLEKARAQIQNSPVNFRRATPESTFELAKLVTFTVRLQVRADPPGFEDFTVPFPGLLLPNVDRISFASFTPPRSLDERKTIPNAPTGAEVTLPKDSTKGFLSRTPAEVLQAPSGLSGGHLRARAE